MTTNNILDVNIQISTTSPLPEHLLPGELRQDQPAGLRWGRLDVQGHRSQAESIQSCTETCGR